MTTAPTDDVTAILTDDHHDVLALIDTIGSTSDPDARRATADTVIAELVRHSVAEEMFVYPAMREALSDGAEQVEHDLAEHKELERTLKALEGIAGDDPTFFERVDEVAEQLRHHSSEEEKTQFPQLRAALSAERLAELGRAVEAAKRVAPTRPHPASPNSQLFHLTLGPGVGLVDKLRDALRDRHRSG